MLPVDPSACRGGFDICGAIFHKTATNWCKSVQRKISMWTLAQNSGWPYRQPGANIARRTIGEKRMAWKTPKIVEVPVGMEINMYACAARK